MLMYFSGLISPEADTVCTRRLHLDYFAGLNFDDLRLLGLVVGESANRDYERRNAPDDDLLGFAHEFSKSEVTGRRGFLQMKLSSPSCSSYADTRVAAGMFQQRSKFWG